MVNVPGKHTICSQLLNLHKYVDVMLYSKQNGKLFAISREIDSCNLWDLPELPSSEGSTGK